MQLRRKTLKDLKKEYEFAIMYGDSWFKFKDWNTTIELSVEYCKIILEQCIKRNLPDNYPLKNLMNEY